MQLNSILATLLLASTAIATAVPEINEHASLITRNQTIDGEEPDVVNFDSTPDVVEDGEPDFDPQELAGDDNTVKIDERDLWTRNHTLIDDEEPDVVNFDSTPDVAEDGEPDFDPQELIGDESKVHIEERDIPLEVRAVSAASKIVKCARSFKGTKYLYGGCKNTAPFGPARGGMDCSCLSRTCIKRGAGTTIPRTTQTQYPSKAGRCHKVARKSAKPGDLVFWGCGTRAGIHHVGVYSKKGYVTHAPHTGTVVKEVKIWTKEICPSVVRCW